MHLRSYMTFECLKVMFKCHVRQYYSVKRKINLSGLLRLMGTLRCVTVTHQELARVTFCLKGRPFRLSSTVLLSESSPLTFFECTAFIQFLPPHSVCLPMALMASQALYIE